jgi:two-component system invasion response regulator UvrY
MTKKKIIIIDDEPLIPALMKEIIEEDQQFQIAEIVTGKDEFLNLVRQHHFDAAIIDISVGGREGGIELLRIMKSEARMLPMVVLSAHDEVHYALKCLQEGARGYINKKYICTDMVQCLKEVLQGSLFVSGDKGENIIKQYKKAFAFLV